jgi:hypothetical protein
MVQVSRGIVLVALEKTLEEARIEKERDNAPLSSRGYRRRGLWIFTTLKF